MKLILSGKNIEIGETLRKQAEKKMKKVSRFFKPDTIANLTVSTENYRHIAEITIPVDGVVFRAEETTNDMFASVDNALEKIERQILKHKAKLEKRFKGGDVRFDFDASSISTPAFEDEYGRIIRHKRFVLKPMTEDEAIMQMDLIGHSFFVFLNIETNEVNVLYKRRDGNYGVIEPDIR